MPEGFRFYLDQMFSLDIALALKKEGYDVIRASEIGQARADDKEILERAISENRILVTLDQHFGDWAVLPLSRHPGVIRLKMNPTTTKNILALLVPFLQRQSPPQFIDSLVILSQQKVKWIATG
jgi:predicted nuclease of predicted toxin-antitoxin system